MTKIDEMVEVATEGLDLDGELRLDVKAELRCHLEDAIDSYSADGKSHEESTSLALKDFGDAPEIAKQLTEANSHRMRFNNLVGILLRRLAVPTAVIMAVLISAGLFVRYNRIVSTYDRLSDMPPALPMGARWHWQQSCVLPYATPIERLPAEQAFLFTGDTTRGSRSSQQRAIWEKDPEDKVYFANYVSEFLADEPSWTPERIEQIVETAGRLDPNNSRYDYLRASFLARHAGNVTSTRRPGDWAAAGYTTSNDALLSEAMAAVARGNAKPAYMRYASEMLERRLETLPDARHVEEQAERLMMVSRVNSPDASMLIHLTLATARYAEMLIAEDKSEEAAEILPTWRHAALKLNEDAFTLNDMKAVSAIAALAKAKIAPLYAKAGMAEEGEACRQFATDIQTQIDEGTSRDGPTKDMRQFGSVLARLATSPTGHVTAGTVMKEGRWAEFSLIEQAGVLIMIAALTVALTGSWMVAARWGGFQREPEDAAGGKPVWLLFSRRKIVHLLTAAIGTPLAVYFAYSRWSPIAARELSPGYLPARFILEMLLVAVTVLGCYSMLAARSVRRRCSELNIGVAAKPGLGYTIAFWCLVTVAWVACLTIRRTPTHPIHRYMPALVCTLTFALLVARQTYVFLKSLLAPRAYRAFYGTAARSSVILCAFAILLLALVVYPTLQWQEGRFLARQRRFSLNAGGNLANVEFAAVVKMKNAIRLLRRSGE